LKQCGRGFVPAEIMSPPARGRGLKRTVAKLLKVATKSPPARGRGLKQDGTGAGQIDTEVAPRTGAWIET